MRARELAIFALAAVVVVAAIVWLFGRGAEEPPPPAPPLIVLPELPGESPIGTVPADSAARWAELETDLAGLRKRIEPMRDRLARETDLRLIAQFQEELAGMEQFEQQILRVVEELK